MKFISILLKEGRKEDLKKKYANKFDEETLDWILNIADLKDFNHKYTDFVLKHVNPEYVDGDVEIGVELIKSFDKYQSQLEKKDINQYSGFEELDNVLVPIHQKQKDRELEKQVDKIYENDKFLVIKPKTHQASCKYGSNTKWCTTAQSPDHFERYTSGSQGLYYIINKANSTDKDYSKVAIHFDNSGYPKFWDSKDSPMGEREIAIFKYAFPEIIDAIEENYKTFKVSAEEKHLNEIFNSFGVTKRSDKKLFGTESELSVVIEGFQGINDLGPGHTEASLAVVLDNVLIDEYQVFVTFKSTNKEYFEASIGFMGLDNHIEEDYFIDLGLENFGIDVKFKIMDTIGSTAEGVRSYISSRCLDEVKKSTKLREKIVGTSSFFRPSYGYTFGRKKGWIEKLVKFLESGKIGTKLDFLTDIGFLNKITKDGKTMYKRTKDGFVMKPRDLRGQHSSFFAAAKNAGILGYRKVGKDFLLIKGPNFNAFKEGKLKAL
jgi:hypothetical protein